MKRYYQLLLLISLAFFSSGCRNKPIGTPCVRTGDGFSASHHCKTLCMSIWRIECPDGTIGDSNLCGGELQCSKGSCPPGQVCYQTNVDRSVCVPQTICEQWQDPQTHPDVSLQPVTSSSATKTTRTAPMTDLPS
jgi:hypothetical protein